jgi:tetratricopeptide (TPR) repeat protein/transcriptional regulator with XRE-family HTH domain
VDEQLSCGRWIKQRRAILDLTQQDLAQRTRCSLVTVKGIESGRRRPSKQLATLLVQALEIPLPEQAAFVRWLRDPAAHPRPGPELPDSISMPAGARSETLPQVQVASLSPARYQLRAPVTDFTGRVQETSQLLAAFQAADQDGAAICAIQGMGGIGKTELAYHVAHRLRATFSDAQIVLHLRGASAAPLSTEEALQAIIRTFMPNAKLSGEALALEQLYHSVLHNQRVLILADDARDAAQVRALIPPAGSTLLITSRQRFTLPGMLSIQLEPLAVEGAVALLAHICPRLNPIEAQAITAACGRLPLALRVSGGILHNTPALPVALYIQGLADEQQRLAQLRDPDDALLDVAATLALSYDRLDSPAQQVFRQLGVIRADFATPLAAALIAPDTNVHIIDTLHLLLRRNLIIYDPERDRWRLHDLVRDLAQRALQAAGERTAALERYAQAAITIAREIHTQYLAGDDQALAALARFDRERPHIDAARQWATTMAGSPVGDALLVTDAIATSAIGDLRYDRRRERLPQLETALQAARRGGDRWGEKQILLNLGNVSYVLGALQPAITCFSAALALARELGDRHDENRTLNNLGASYINLGDPRQAIIYYEQAIAIARDLSDRRGEGRTLGNLGNAYMDLGDTQRAIPVLEFIPPCTNAPWPNRQFMPKSKPVYTWLGLPYGSAGVM